jgi:hypothetical protein
MLIYEVKQAEDEFLIGYYKAPGRSVFVPMATATTANMAEAARAGLQTEANKREIYAQHHAARFVPGRVIRGFYDEDNP